MQDFKKLLLNDNYLLSCSWKSKWSIYGIWSLFKRTK